MPTKAAYTKAFDVVAKQIARDPKLRASWEASIAGAVRYEVGTRLHHALTAAIDEGAQKAAQDFTTTLIEKVKTKKGRR